MREPTQPPPKRGTSLRTDTTFVVGVPWTDSFGDFNSSGWAQPWPGHKPDWVDGDNGCPEKKSRSDDRR